MGTYEIIKALPGKTTNWAAINAALRAKMADKYIDPQTEARWNERGIRAARAAAMEMAAIIVQRASTSSRFLPPSEETLSWGGFLGGETVVLYDDEAHARATAQIAELVRGLA
jgi:hypothetical protein